MRSEKLQKVRPHIMSLCHFPHSSARIAAHQDLVHTLLQFMHTVADLSTPVPASNSLPFPHFPRRCPVPSVISKDWSGGMSVELSHICGTILYEYGENPLCCGTADVSVTGTLLIVSSL